MDATWKTKTRKAKGHLLQNTWRRAERNETHTRNKSEMNGTWSLKPFVPIISKLGRKGLSESRLTSNQFRILSLSPLFKWADVLHTYFTYILSGRESLIQWIHLCPITTVWRMHSVGASLEVGTQLRAWQVFSAEGFAVFSSAAELPGKWKLSEICSQESWHEL